MARAVALRGMLVVVVTMVTMVGVGSGDNQPEVEERRAGGRGDEGRATGTSKTRQKNDRIATAGWLLFCVCAVVVVFAVGGEFVGEVPGTW
jgi:hypothetical protein